MMREVQTWFIELCGIYPPDDDRAWRLSFDEICSEVGVVVEHCQSAVVLAVSTPDDKEDIVADLRNRLDRSWPAYRFDELVRDACIRFRLNVDASKFSEPRLPKWRQYLETVPEDDDPKRQITAIIERDILDYTNDILPINGEDVMDSLNLDSGPGVGDALRHARELFRSGIRDRDQLLEHLKSDWLANTET